MNKKRITGFAIATMLLITSVCPAFAATGTGSTSTDKAAKAEARLVKDAEKAQRQAEKLASLQAKAVKLGITIEGMTLDAAKTALDAAAMLKLESVAKRLGVDPTGLTKEQLKAAIEAAKQEKATEKPTTTTGETGTEQ